MSMEQALRKPVVAGQFYPGSPDELQGIVQSFLEQATEPEQKATLLAMAPHAGYVFSGAVAGMTLGAAKLADRVVLLGPNHTGRGERLSLWNCGLWESPCKGLKVDEELVQVLLDAEPLLVPDFGAHVREHSLEVLIPFLETLNPDMRIVPIAISEPSPEVLMSVGEHVGKALAALEEPVSLVVSSDMSHYVSERVARELDSAALQVALKLDPLLLYETVRSKRISMCGVLPMTLALAAVREMGATEARITAYSTSGDVTGDFDQVVGYAGMIVS